MAKSLFGTDMNKTSLFENNKKSDDEKKLDDFVKSWIESDDWNGANIFPYQFILTEEYSIVLKRTIEFIKNQKQYQDKGYLLIEPPNKKNGNDGEKICIEMHKYSGAFKRNKNGKHQWNFRRGEYNFLNHLGLMTTKTDSKNDNRFLITPDGLKFSNLSTLEEIKEFYKNIFSKIVWFKRPDFKIHPIQFLFNILNNMGTISFDEYKFIVIYATSDSQFNEIINLINIYRNFPNKKDEYENYFKTTRTLKNINTINQKLQFNLMSTSILGNFIYDIEKGSLELNGLINVENIKETINISEEILQKISIPYYFYIMRSNQDAENMYKLGITDNVERRRKEHSGGTTRAIPYVAKKVWTIDYIYARSFESGVFSLLAKYRVDTYRNSELFILELNKMIKSIEKFYEIFKESLSYGERIELK